jgi:hypothetical protein
MAITVAQVVRYSSIFSVVPRPTMASYSAQMTLPGFEWTRR